MASLADTMTDEIEPIWYLIHTKAGQEAKAVTRLERLGYPTFFAFDRVRRRRKRGNAHIVEWVERPHFSRYIFAAIRNQSQSIMQIEDQNEVSSVVRRGISGEPCIIPATTIAELSDRAMVRFDVPGYRLLMRELVLDPDKVVTLFIDKHRRRRISRELVPAA